MIEFGLFSSQLPYIIFIALYMLYFGASSLNTHDKEELALKSKVTERPIVVDTHLDNKTLIYRINSCVRFVAEKQIERIKHFIGYSLSKRFYIRDKIIHNPLFTGSSVFSRPPPFSSCI